MTEIYDIWDRIKRDTQEKRDYPLKGDDGDDALIRELAKDYGTERLRAMWNYYISDETERGYGISVEAFTEPRRLAKYADRVTKKKHKVGEGKQHYCETYVCEYSHSYRDSVKRWYGQWLTADEKQAWADSLPEVHEHSCPVCGGRCLSQSSLDRRWAADTSSENFNLLYVGKPWAEYLGTPEHSRTMKRLEQYHQTGIETFKYEHIYANAMKTWQELAERKYNELRTKGMPGMHRTDVPKTHSIEDGVEMPMLRPLGTILEESRIITEATVEPEEEDLSDLIEGDIDFF